MNSIVQFINKEKAEVTDIEDKNFNLYVQKYGQYKLYAVSFGHSQTFLSVIAATCEDAKLKKNMEKYIGLVYNFADNPEKWVKVSGTIVFNN